MVCLVCVLNIHWQQKWVEYTKWGRRERSEKEWRGRKLYFSKEDCEFCVDMQTQGKCTFDVGQKGGGEREGSKDYQVLIKHRL